MISTSFPETIEEEEGGGEEGGGEEIVCVVCVLSVCVVCVLWCVMESICHKTCMKVTGQITLWAESVLSGKLSKLRSPDLLSKYLCWLSHLTQR